MLFRKVTGRITAALKLDEDVRRKNGLEFERCGKGMIIDELLLAADSVQMRDRLRNSCGLQCFAVGVQKSQALGVKHMFGGDKKVEGNPSRGVACGHSDVHGERAAGTASPTRAREKQGGKG